MHDFRTAYDALRRRDPAFDGRFYVGVTTTGIYCRPTCPARTPLAKNIVLFSTSKAAEGAGYRPCKRCRPETKPFSPPWKGSRTTVERAVSLMKSGKQQHLRVDQLALTLGIGARHLRRLFARHLQTSPRRFANALKKEFAAKLLRETTLPAEAIAQQAGFSSARRLRAALGGTRKLRDRNVSIRGATK
jgi:AraC family transcriptional regulator, regulatory protein of adaptative response / methylated-DNA-[protein]-cysteine methyltransferase